MKVPDLNELVSESYPNCNNNLNINKINKPEEYILELKNKIEELERINALHNQENINLKKEIEILKDRIIKSEYENKSNITLLKTKINNLKDENEKYNKSLQEMNSINQKLCSDNKTLMLELDKNLTDISKLTVQDNNKNIWGNELKKLLENKEKLANELKLNLVNSEDKIKKLYEDNKQLSEINKKMKKEIDEIINEKKFMNDKINEMNINLKKLDEELNIKNQNVVLLEKEIEKLNLKLKDYDNNNNNLNDVNLSLKNQNREIIDNYNNLGKKLSSLEDKNKSLLDDLNKKENQINNIQEICMKQEKEIMNLINQNNKINNSNKNSLILIKEIKNKNGMMYDQYENLNKKINSIKNILHKNENLDKFISDNKIKFIENNNNYSNIDEINKIDNNDEFNYNIYPLKMKEEHKTYYLLNEENINNSIKNYKYDYSGNKKEITMDKKYDFLFQNKNK